MRTGISPAGPGIVRSSTFATSGPVAGGLASAAARACAGVSVFKGGSSNVALCGNVENRYMATNVGTRLQTARKLLRVVDSATTRAEDGIDHANSYFLIVASVVWLPSA